MRITCGILLVCGIAAGCGPEHPELATGDTPDATLAYASAEPGAERFGLGRPATAGEVARLDVDVMPDGTGLPPGRGTVPQGAEVYRSRCAACHGLAGEGASADRLVADGPKHAFPCGDDPDAFAKRTIGNYWPHATTLFDYVRRSMPFDRPGSLSDDEVYAVIAWLLWMNEVIGEDVVLDAATLPRVEMPARDRFVRDDRTTSDRVR